MDVKRWIKTWFNLKVAIVSIALFLFLNLSGIQNLGTDTSDFNKWIFLASKGLHFVFLYGVGYKIASLIKNRHTKEGKTELILLAVCFAVYTVLLLLIWPGAWSWDDIYILLNAQTYLPIAWQHIFSGIAISVFLQTIPLAGGAMLVQAFCASLIAAYCVTKLSYAFVCKRKEENENRIEIEEKRREEKRREEKRREEKRREEKALSDGRLDGDDVFFADCTLHSVGLPHGNVLIFGAVAVDKIAFDL